jgi:hypothetical protein
MVYDTPFVPRPNTGSLFVNKVKRDENSADYSGELLIDVNSLVVVDGVATVKVWGRKKVSKAGTTFLSLSISNPQPQQGQQATSPRPSSSLADMDDDIPF